mmetsp:Transcript_26968/g.90272  ORF Transcript_26968/g.90272 Transcript_26968/m.90272 type:complete len:236 (-) Transcript_26968:2995-3702(-)
MPLHVYSLKSHDRRSLGLLTRHPSAGHLVDDEVRALDEVEVFAVHAHLELAAGLGHCLLKGRRLRGREDLLDVVGLGLVLEGAGDHGGRGARDRDLDLHVVHLAHALGEHNRAGSHVGGREEGAADVLGHLRVVGVQDPGVALLLGDRLLRLLAVVALGLGVPLALALGRGRGRRAAVGLCRLGLEDAVEDVHVVLDLEARFLAQSLHAVDGLAHDGLVEHLLVGHHVEEEHHLL